MAESGDGAAAAAPADPGERSPAVPGAGGPADRPLVEGEARPPSKLAAAVHAWVAKPHPQGFLVARFIVLRGLGLIFLSAFYSFARQVDGLIGPHGILPAADYLNALHESVGAPLCYLYAPTVLWLGASTHALDWVVGAGIIASLTLVANVAPRVAVLVCEALFLSLIAASQVFAAYQSDGMLLEAGLLAAFFAPRGLWPGLARAAPPSRAARFLLVWEWFRIYFESGIVKLASGDPQWRNLTALDHYYENGPLPTWIGWYAQHLPHGFHAATALATLVLELGVVWLAFLPRRLRLLCFACVTPFQLGIIATANYAFLNYLVLLLGFLLVDDDAAHWIATHVRRLLGGTAALGRGARASEAPAPRQRTVQPRATEWALAGYFALFFYATLVRFPLVPRRELGGLLTFPADVLDYFRVANGYGLFAVMTRERIELEFQGSTDGVTFVPYRFGYKPQDPHAPPGIYAPYQPRFEWNLWFASLENWRANRWVIRTEARLLDAEPSVLALFAYDPFGGTKPAAVRTVAYRYRFSDPEAKRTRGVYWEREELGVWGPELERTPQGPALRGARAW